MELVWRWSENQPVWEKEQREAQLPSPQQRNRPFQEPTAGWTQESRDVGEMELDQQSVDTPGPLAGLYFQPPVPARGSHCSYKKEVCSSEVYKPSSQFGGNSFKIYSNLEMRNARATLWAQEEPLP